jgi:hypothetical protein
MSNAPSSLTKWIGVGAIALVVAGLIALFAWSEPTRLLKAHEPQPPPSVESGPYANVVAEPRDTDRTSPALLGQVLDALTGAPVADAAVTAVNAQNRTSVDGRFTIPLQALESVGAALELRVEADGYAPASLQAEPGVPLLARIARARGLSVRLLEAGSGSPVDGFRVSVLSHVSDDMSAARRGSRKRIEHALRAHDAGWAWFRDVAPGQYIVEATPSAIGHVAPKPHVTTWTSGHATLVLEARRATELAVKLRHADGSRPGANYEVKLAVTDEPHSRWTDYGDVQPVTMAEYAWHYPHRKQPLLLASGRLDSNGTIRLPCPRGERVLVVVGTAGATVRATAHAARDHDFDELTITLPPCAVVSGRLLPPELLRAIHPESQEFWDQAGAPRTANAPAPTVVALAPERTEGVSWQANLSSDGTFRLDHVPAGKWNLHLSYHVIDGPKNAVHRSAPLGEFEWWTGGERFVEIDAKNLVPQRIALICVAQGEPLKHGRLLIQDMSSARTVASAMTDDAGVARVRLEPGRFVIRADTTVRAAVVTLGGDGSEHRVDLGLGPVTVQLRGNAGAALTGRRIRLVATDFRWSSQARITDSHGTATIPDVPQCLGGAALEVEASGRWVSNRIGDGSLTASLSSRVLTVTLSQ